MSKNPFTKQGSWIDVNNASALAQAKVVASDPVRSAGRYQTIQIRESAVRSNRQGRSYLSLNPALTHPLLLAELAFPIAEGGDRNPRLFTKGFLGQAALRLFVNQSLPLVPFRKLPTNFSDEAVF